MPENKPVPELAESNPERSELRQPHLARVTRVSKMLHGITIPILYHTVMTDDFPSLIACNVSLRPTPWTPNLHFTEKLFIEYGQKGVTPHYGQLCGDGGPWWVYCEGTMESTTSLAMNEYHTELGSLYACLRYLCGVGMAYNLPRLRSIAIGALYTFELYNTWSWYDYEGYCGDEEILKLRSEFHSWVMSGNILSFCARDVCGPLSLNGVVPPGFESTFHFFTLAGRLPITFYRNDMPGTNSTHWAYEGPPSADWSHTIAILGKRLDRITTTFPPGHSFDLNISCCTNMCSGNLTDIAHFDAEKSLFSTLFAPAGAILNVFIP